MEMPNCYDSLKSYATYMFNRNLKVFTQNIHTPLDYVHNVFMVGFESVDHGKKIILDQILTERRSLIANIQQSGNISHFNIREKRCSCCLNTKPIEEYSPRLDSRTAFKYYDSYCRECRNEKQRERRSKHVITEHERKLNRERQRRWAKRQKEIKIKK